MKTNIKLASLQVPSGILNNEIRTNSISIYLLFALILLFQHYLAQAEYWLPLAVHFVPLWTKTRFIYLLVSGLLPNL